jgi:hypothetical protein
MSRVVARRIDSSMLWKLCFAYPPSDSIFHHRGNAIRSGEHLLDAHQKNVGNAPNAWSEYGTLHNVGIDLAADVCGGGLRDARRNCRALT